MSGNRRLRGGRFAAAVLAAALVGMPAAGWGKSLGVIYPEACSVYDGATEALKSYLAANGFGPDALEIYIQKPSADPMSWTNALRKLVAVETDVIVVFGDSLLLAACKEKIKSPIGFGFVLEPALCSCVRSAANPKGVASGASAKTPLATLLAKARLMTDYTSVGIIEFAGDAVVKAQIGELRAREKEFGFTVRPIAVSRYEDAGPALRAAPAPGLFLLPSCSLAAAFNDDLLAIALERKIATISLQPPRGAQAALLALYPDPEEQGRLVGEVVVQVLTKGPGAAPAAPLSPKKIELEVNVPLARQLGVKVPMELLDSATRVIK